MVEGTYNLRIRCLAGSGYLVSYVNKWNGSGFQQVLKKRKIKAGRSTTYKNVVVVDAGGLSFTNGYFLF